MNNAPGDKTAPVVEPQNELKDVEEAVLYIDRCLGRLEKETDLTGERAAAVVLAAERTVAVFWGADTTALSPATRDKIDQYPRRIREWIDKINEAKSVKILEEVEKLSAQTHAKRHERRDGARQPLIDVTTEGVGHMLKLLNGMTAGKSLDKAADLLLRLQTDLNNDRREQLNRYQRQAIERCHQFNRFVLENTVARDSTLQREFDEADIAAIDVSLLGAEARRIYEIAVGLMDSKLKERTRADFLVKLTEAKKWSISDF